MKLSTRARYALRMMLDVARNSSDLAPVSLASVARRIDLSRGYLEQVACALRSAGLLRGVAGRRGGYRLAVPPSEITVGRVLEASIGPICLVDCVHEPELCPRSESCECRLVYRLINERIQDVLQSYTLADLLDPAWVRRFAGSPTADLRGADPVEGCGCTPGLPQTQGDDPHAGRSGE